MRFRIGPRLWAISVGAGMLVQFLRAARRAQGCDPGAFVCELQRVSEQLRAQLLDVCPRGAPLRWKWKKEVADAVEILHGAASQLIGAYERPEGPLQ